MLTADLVQASVSRGEVRPRWIDTGDRELRELAACLIAIFEEHVGRSRRELQQSLDELLGTGTEYLLHRGLAKLLFDRSELTVEAPGDPAELRRALFETAAAIYRSDSPCDREALVRAAAERLALQPEDIERGLYADLKEEQCIADFERIAPEKLLERYNVALAQAVLLKACFLEIEISDQSARRYRELFRSIKFHRLLHSVSGTAEAGYRIRLDGPLSLFRSSQRYGLQMATFLPTLLAFDSWRLEAEVLWGRHRARRRFALASGDGLVSPRHLRGQWQPGELRWLSERFAKLESEWEIEDATELIDLEGAGVLVPDHAFRHRPTGKRVYMEVFGFWRRGAVESRLELLRRHGPRNLIVAVGADLRLEEDALELLPGEVYVFRTHPIAREVLEILEGMV